MKSVAKKSPMMRPPRCRKTVATIAFCGGVLLSLNTSAALVNLLQNPGFEAPASSDGSLPGWTSTSDGAEKAAVGTTDVHAGRQAVAIPANVAIEQKIASAAAGPYLFRAWVKSAAAQSVTIRLQNDDQPWLGYTCAEVPVPAGQWTKVEAFCSLQQDGPLTVSFGGTSKDFRFYHGAGAELTAAMAADDCELIRYTPFQSAEKAALSIWDAPGDLGVLPDLTKQSQWTRLDDSPKDFAGTPVVQAGQMLGRVRNSDGAFLVFGRQGTSLKQRCVIIPAGGIATATCALVQSGSQRGIRIAAKAGDRAYTAWISPEGLVRIEAKDVPKFEVRDCRLSYALLPTFVGTDLCYPAAKIPNENEWRIPSTQWLVGLVDGCDSMLVAAWESPAQSVALAARGAGEQRRIETFSIDTQTKGFTLALIEHARVWHREPLKEDWLGDYVPIGWQRPFPARWMCHFFVTAGGEASFRRPHMDYTFPMADAKTRMWGVWFEDWNRYPAYFDGPRTMLHFEKTFLPVGDALIYFLEPAAADLLSPCEVVERTLGHEKATALFDFDANRLRKLTYSTPDEFMYDRPVCATTTRLSHIKQGDKATVGINLATHLYEFIREIRRRVDQYSEFFNGMHEYLAAEKKAHPELAGYLEQLDKQVVEGQSKTNLAYNIPLSEVQSRTDRMKEQLKAGKDDGFECHELDVRGPAGSQDDLCRHYNRLVLRLVQTAAFNAGDSDQKIAVAQHLWQESRGVLRQPTRWESRRTLYFFEP